MWKSEQSEPTVIVLFNPGTAMVTRMYMRSLEGVIDDDDDNGFRMEIRNEPANKNQTQKRVYRLKHNMLDWSMQCVHQVLYLYKRDDF